MRSPLLPRAHNKQQTYQRTSVPGKWCYSTLPPIQPVLTLHYRHIRPDKYQAKKHPRHMSCCERLCGCLSACTTLTTQVLRGSGTEAFQARDICGWLSVVGNRSSMHARMAGHASHLQDWFGDTPAATQQQNQAYRLSLTYHPRSRPYGRSNILIRSLTLLWHASAVVRVLSRWASPPFLGDVLNLSPWTSKDGMASWLFIHTKSLNRQLLHNQ